MVHHLANCLDENENVHLVSHEASQVDGLARIILGEGLGLATVALGPDEIGRVKKGEKMKEKCAKMAEKSAPKW